MTWGTHARAVNWMWSSHWFCLKTLLMNKSLKKRYQSIYDEKTMQFILHSSINNLFSNKQSNWLPWLRFSDGRIIMHKWKIIFQPQMPAYLITLFAFSALTLPLTIFFSNTNLDHNWIIIIVYWKKYRHIEIMIDVFLHH